MKERGTWERVKIGPHTSELSPLPLFTIWSNTSHFPKANLYFFLLLEYVIKPWQLIFLIYKLNPAYPQVLVYSVMAVPTRCSDILTLK